MDNSERSDVTGVLNFDGMLELIPCGQVTAAVVSVVATARVGQPSKA
jgi:hypothetical protein